MSDSIYNHSFEEAFEAIKQGHEVEYLEPEIRTSCHVKPAEKMFARCVEGMMSVVMSASCPHRVSVTGWAIIEKKSDKELLIEHFKSGEMPVLIKDTNRVFLKVVGANSDYFICSQFGKTRWDMFDRLLFRAEALSLVLERDE